MEFFKKEKVFDLFIICAQPCKVVLNTLKALHTHTDVVSYLC